MRTVLTIIAMALLPLATLAQDTCFTAQPIPDAVFQRMQGKSFPTGCTTKRSDLRYLRLSYCDMEGHTRQGEMVCHKSIAADLVSIFRQLWLAGYRIGSMRLIDDFDADDQLSMANNNTSCFCFRTVSGTQTVSKHGRGMAVDINPLYNPYIYSRSGKNVVEPKEGAPYARNRDQRSDIPCKIDRQDLCYRLFRQHGFKWGGAWTRSKDYQHFER